jgi:hypothetical protein
MLGLRRRHDRADVIRISTPLALFTLRNNAVGIVAGDKKPAVACRGGLNPSQKAGLRFLDVGGLLAFGALHHLERNLFTLF